jgi:hypothetical protein
MIRALRLRVDQVGEVADVVLGASTDGDELVPGPRPWRLLRRSPVG